MEEQNQQQLAPHSDKPNKKFYKTFQFWAFIFILLFIFVVIILVINDNSLFTKSNSKEIADTIVRYPNASNWNIRHTNGWPNDSPHTKISFTSTDQRKDIVSFYASQPGWVIERATSTLGSAIRQPILKTDTEFNDVHYCVNGKRISLHFGDYRGANNHYFYILDKDIMVCTPQN